MPGSERKKKLKGMGWPSATPKQVVNIYSTSLQRILNELWTEFPDSLRSKEEDNGVDIHHYDNLISCFNKPFASKVKGDKEMAIQLMIVASSEEEPSMLEQKIVKLLLSGGKGLNKKIISNKQRGRRRLRIEATCKLYIYFAKSQKGLTNSQENATLEFTDQVKCHYLQNV